MRLNWIGSFALASVFATTAVASRPEPNAFLDEPVSNTGQLVKQVRTDTAVRDRYMRHFGMSESELNAYMSSLRPSEMPDAETLDVYSVPGSGAVKVHQQLVKKGEKVFVDPEGKPALLVRCGNPLSQGPSNRMNTAIMMPSLTDNATLVAQTVPIGDLQPIMTIEPRPEIAMTEPPDTIADIVTEPETTTTTIVPSTILTPPSTAVVAPTISTGGGSKGLGGLFLLPLLGGLAFLGSNHGGGSPPIVPTPTPEPVGMILLGSSAAALLVRRKRKH